jgi:hypothetical protein
MPESLVGLNATIKLNRLFHSGSFPFLIDGVGSDSVGCSWRLTTSTTFVCQAVLNWYDSPRAINAQTMRAFLAASATAARL